MQRSVRSLALLAAALAVVHAPPPAAGRHILLAGEDVPGRVRFLSQSVQLAEGATQSWVTLTRTGNFTDPRYGEFAITADMLGQMVANFDKRVLGQDVFIDVSHKPSDGAAGKVLKLSVESGRLRALVEWTPFGLDAIKQRGFTYLSAEYHEAWKDNEAQKPHGCVLLGAGLTVRPVIKHLEPVQLSDDYDHATDVRTAISPSLIKELTEFSMNKHLQALLARLITLGFTEATAKPFLDAATPGIAAAGTDEAKCLAVVETFATLGGTAATQTKAAGGDPKTVTITLAAPNVDVAGELTKLLAARDAAAATDAATLATKVKLLSDTIAAGDKTLTPEGVKKFADDYAPLVTAATTDDQVKHLASLAVKQAQELGAAKKLAGLGYVPASGNVHISVDSSNGIKALQEQADLRLGLVADDPRRFARTGGILLAANKAFAEKALAQFDSLRGVDLDAEHKQLSGGLGNLSDNKLPAVFERTVLREMLYNLTSLSFMDVGTYPFAATVTIPYSYRDTTAAGVSGLRVYERGAVQNAGVVQTAENAYPIPQKLGFDVSNEMRYLVAAAPIDFDVIAENTRNAIRVVAEDTEALNMNELLRSADEHLAVAVTGEALTANVNGTNKTFVLAQYPVVRPRKLYDLQGTQIGSTTNPIVVTLNSVVREEYDGTGTQATGTYYTLDYNLGELRFVTQAGVSVTPTSAWALTVSYSYTQNVSKFDTDLGTLTVKDKYDLLLTAIGSRKVVIGNDRYYNPNMALWSAAVDNMLTQAGTFTANGARLGTSLNADGSVGVTKGIGTFNTTAPNLFMGDTRILVGERYNSRYRMLKPFSMNAMEQKKDSNGKFVGAMTAYGDQYVAVHTPTMRRNALTGIVLYSATGRVNRTT
jgi:hypothetical protein